MRRIPWINLIKYDFETHHPFELKGLSMDYVGVRDLLKILKDIIDRKGEGSYSLLLDQINLDIIRNRLEELRKGEISLSLEALLKELSLKEYQKGGNRYKMFDFESPKPFHKLCHRILPSEVKRRCSKCNELSMVQIVQTQEYYKTIKSARTPKNLISNEFKHFNILKCNKCSKSVPVRHLNCPYCNPEDLPSFTFPEEKRKNAFIFPDQLGWNPPVVKFDTRFYDTILKGIHFEQEIYHRLKYYIPENQIRISTLVKTSANNGWGIEIDILFVDKRQGKVIKNYDWTLFAIEIKNHKKKIGSETIQKFYDEVSPITKNLIFISKSGFDWESYGLTRSLKIHTNVGSLDKLFI